MKTININGKEYTESQFTKLAAFQQSFKALPETDYGDVLIEAFEDLRDDFPRHEAEPPTLRPMSELPEVNKWVNVLIEDSFHKERRWQIGKQSKITGGVISGGSHYGRIKDTFRDPYTRVILGWLPLPNPDEIKLPC